MEEPTNDLTDEQIEAIHEEGAAAAEGAWGPAGSVNTDCPYPEGSHEADIWQFAFRNAYARSA